MRTILLLSSALWLGAAPGACSAEGFDARLAALGTEVRRAAGDIGGVQVRGENNGGYAVKLAVTSDRVRGTTNGGYPIDLALSRDGASCRVTGRMLGGYPVDASLSSGRATGRTMGGYPLDLELKDGRISGVAKSYEVSLKRDGLRAAGVGVGHFPVRLTLSAPLDDCQFVAVAIAVLHRH